MSRDQRYNQVGKIKHMITGKTVRMESKFINGWEETNHMNAAFLSNEIMPWPISEDDRRMLVMWPLETLPAERQKAIARELANGGVAALYGWLLSVDLEDFNQRIPWTDCSTAQGPRRFAAFFMPNDGDPSLPPSMNAAVLGKNVREWRERAKLAGWTVEGWDHIKRVAA